MKDKIQELKEKALPYLKTMSGVVSKGDVTMSSIVIAYYTLFSIFPLTLVIANILPLFHIDTRPIIQYLEVVFPKQIATMVIPVVNSIFKKQSGGFAWLGIILGIWSVSGLINSVRVAMNRIYGVHHKERGQSFVQVILTRSLTFLITGTLIILFALIIFAFAFGRQIMEFLAPIFNFSLDWVYQVEKFRWPVIGLTMIFIIFYLNYALPNIKNQNRHIWSGVLTTAVLWTGLSFFFGMFIRNFGSKWQTYGLVGSVIVFMLWLNLSALFFLLGVSFNAARDKLTIGDAEYDNHSFLASLFHKDQD